MKKKDEPFNAGIFLQKLIEEERAFLNSEEWGLDLRPVFRKVVDPPGSHEELDDKEISRFLKCMIDLLAQHHLCLLSTSHLTDRELYQLIIDEVLPQPLGIGPNPIGSMVYHECRDLSLPDLEPEEVISERDDWIPVLAESYRSCPLPDFANLDTEAHRSG